MQKVKERIINLVRELNAHNYNYYVLDKPTISDYEFDLRLQELIDFEKQYPAFVLPDSPTQRVGVKSPNSSNMPSIVRLCCRWEIPTTKQNCKLSMQE